MQLSKLPVWSLCLTIASFAFAFSVAVMVYTLVPREDPYYNIPKHQVQRNPDGVTEWKVYQGVRFAGDSYQFKMDPEQVSLGDTVLGTTRITSKEMQILSAAGTAVGLSAADNTVNGLTLKLPASAGHENQFITSNGQGQMRWTTLNQNNVAISAIDDDMWTGAPLALRHGGTAATTASDARISLGLGPFSTPTFAALVITGTVDGRDVSVDGAALDNLKDTIGLAALTSAEVDQLENIDSTTISAAQWAYLGTLDQSLTQADTVTFATINGTLGTAAQGNVTSLGTLTALQVDQLNLNASTITFSGITGANQIMIPDNFANGLLVTNGTEHYIQIVTTNLADEIQLLQNTSVTGNITVSGTVDGRDVAADGTALDNLKDTIGLAALTSAEVDQLENIDTTSISAAQWAYLGTLDQSLTQADTVTFATINGTLGTAAQGNVTSLGTLTALQVDQLNLNASTITFSGITGANQIIIPDNFTSGLLLTNGTENYIQIVTTNLADEIQLLQNTSVTGNITVSGTVDGRDVAADGTALDNLKDTIGLAALTSVEVDQLENIDSTTISAAQWAYLGTLDQSLTQADTVTFATINGTLGTAAQGNVTSLGTLTALQVDQLNLNASTITFSGITGANQIMIPDNFANGLLVTNGTEHYIQIVTTNLADEIQLLQNTSVTGNITVSGTVDGRDVAADGTALDNLKDTIGLAALTSAEVDQLENIDSTTISAAQWAYLGTLDQSLTQADTVTFATINGTLGTAAQGNVTSLGTLTGLTVNNSLNVACNGVTSGSPLLLNGTYVGTNDAEWKWVSNFSTTIAPVYVGTVGRVAAQLVYPTYSPGAGCTVTDAIALHVGTGVAGGAGACTTGYGLWVDNPAWGTAKVAAYIGGNVGIAVTDPDTRLEVLDGGGTQLKLSFDGTDNCTFGVNTDGRLDIIPSGTDVIVNKATAHLGVGDFTGSNIAPRFPLCLRADPADSSAPVAIYGNTANDDTHTLLTLQGTGNVANEKVGMQLGFWSDDTGTGGRLYSVGGMFCVGDSTSNNTSGDLTFDMRVLDSDTVLTEVMRITHEGNVGINVNDPDTRLEVLDGGGTQLKLSYDATRNCTLGVDINGYLTVNASGGFVVIPDAVRLDATGGYYCDFSVSGSPNGHLNIAPSVGKVGINVSDPDTRLEVFDGGGTQLKLSFDGEDNCTFGVNGSGYMNITPSGGRIGIGVASPLATVNIEQSADNSGIRIDDTGKGAGLLYISAVGKLTMQDAGGGSNMQFLNNAGTSILELQDDKTVQTSNHTLDTISLLLNKNGTGNRYASLDFYGDDVTPSGHALRIIRRNTGQNAQSALEHYGTGSLTFNAVSAADMIFATNNTTRVTITSAGYVGMGNNLSDPDTRLEIMDSGVAQLKLSYDATFSCTLTVPLGGGLKITPSAGIVDIVAALQSTSIDTGALEASQITSTGSIIFTNGNINGSTGVYSSSADVSCAGLIAASSITCHTNNTYRPAGGDWLVLSDRKFKTNIIDITATEAQTRIQDLRPRMFKFLPNYRERYSLPNRYHHGFIAQEFQQVFPDDVRTNNDGLCLDGSSIVSNLVRVVQSLLEDVAILKKKLGVAEE